MLPVNTKLFSLCLKCTQSIRFVEAVFLAALLKLPLTDLEVYQLREFIV